MPRAWLTAEQAAARLSVKIETLYAYASRGLVHSERVPGGRRTRYRRADVERLAMRAGRGGRAGALEIVVETELTLLEPAGALYYRGWDVADAARTARFEEVASWLWTGVRSREPFVAAKESVTAVASISSARSEASPLDRVRAAVLAMRGADPLRDDRRPAAVAAAGRSMIAGVLHAVPLLGHEPRGLTPSVAARLWPRVTPRPPSAARVRQLETALVLLADHELAASTLAARVAASTWADPYLVVTAGLAALGGPLHGGSAEECRAILREVSDGRLSAAEAVGARLRAGQYIAGFGHSVYLERDPRAEVLIEMTSGARPSGAARAGHEVLATMRARDLPFANVDFGLALLAETHEMMEGATEVIFAVARIAGWLAHAVEEYQHRLRFRPRAAYIGPAPAEREDA